MAADLGASVSDLLSKSELRSQIKLSQYVTDKVGLPTLNDIMAELEKPGRDVRSEFVPFAFTEGVDKMEDLSPGMKLPGIVTNVTAFGAFVDVGVHQDGLVHISEMADGYVRDPSAVLKVQDRVMVTVLEIDLARGRLALSLKSKPGQSERRAAPSEDRPKGGPARGRNARPQKAESSPFNNPFAALKK